MGTIVYHNGLLVGDSRFYDNIGGINIPFEKPRIVLDRFKRFAYGICGNNIPFSNPNFDATIDAFISAYIKDPQYDVEFPYKEIHILVMTGSQTFTIYNDGTLSPGQYSKQFIPHEPHAVIAYGTGSSNAIMSIIAGSDAVAALEDVAVYDFYTGGDLYGVKRSTLDGAEDIDVGRLIEHDPHPRLPVNEDRGWFKSTLSRINTKG